MSPTKIPSEHTVGKPAARWRILTLVVLLTACSSVTARVQPYLGGPALPPTDPNGVAILRTEPTRTHERLGEVFAEPSGDPTVAQFEQALREGGAKMGADAVVIVYDRFQVVGTILSGPWWAPTTTPVYGRVVVGLAIRYTAP